MEMPNLSGKAVVITGANSGIGLETAKILADCGAAVMLAVRNIEKGRIAKDEILRQTPGAAIEVMPLDLADLASIQTFSDHFRTHFHQLDLLINNAGIMMPPLSYTKDGFELQFGSNHLGHFALTGHLLPILINTPGSRIVTVSSRAHDRGTIRFENLDGSKGYKAKKFYNQSKLANLYFALELDKRLKQHGLPVRSIVCHPGISVTNIFKFGNRSAPLAFRNLANRFLQPPELGALPTIYAATEESLLGGEYIGPDGPGRIRGYPALDTPHPIAQDAAVSQKLWAVSEQLAGVTFNFKKN
ncbi:oxidoreductase [Planococcus ruber]|uniref:oxidoreductase n=1 Tax=Planococcus ruber TaxID=2027871 RepID=UPI003132A891